MKNIKLVDEREDGRVGLQGVRDKEFNLNYEVREGFIVERRFVLRFECLQKQL